MHQILKSVDDKYLFIQRWEREDYYIINQHFQYIREKNWEKLSFVHRPPFYVDGMFLYYETLDWEPIKRSIPKEMYLKEAYFEDGTKVWDIISTLGDTLETIQWYQRKELKKIL
jgi:hypothetical protein